MLVMVLSRHLSCGAMSMLSYAGGDTAESCWRLHCRGDVDHGVMSLLSHADDGATESCWQWRCRGN
jgi:hypothetical protein